MHRSEGVSVEWAAPDCFGSAPSSAFSRAHSQRVRFFRTLDGANVACLAVRLRTCQQKARKLHVGGVNTSADDTDEAAATAAIAKQK